MRRTLLALLLCALLAAVAACAKQAAPPEPQAQAQLTVDPNDLPPAPAEGTELAQAAEQIPIENGPRTPQRHVLLQEPQQRPCWAMAEGYDRCDVDRPGRAVYVGNSSGAAERDGAILNAYQNAVELLARDCLARSADKSPQARELVRARAYYYSGLYQRQTTLAEDVWTQKWEERFQDHMRVYYRAFVLLVVSQDVIDQIAAP